VRKLLCSNTLVVAALSVLASGCGGGPTAPTAPVVSQGDVTPLSPPAPAPTPEPTPEPTPTPRPPTPAPPPPPPTPAESVVRYEAHVETVHWYGTPLFSSIDIEIRRYADRIVIESLTLPIVVQDDRSVLARSRDMSFSASDSRWSFNGIAGQGSGVWTTSKEPPK
jgi:hypothetical protein